MKTEQDVSEKIEQVKTMLRNCQIDLSTVVGTRPFENFKETYQNRIIKIISQLTDLLHKL